VKKDGEKKKLQNDPDDKEHLEAVFQKGKSSRYELDEVDVL
jgi:hypothetical protein